MVGDYRALNTTTKPDRYPLPFLNDFADMLHGCTVFSKLDCYKGYHQIPMAAEDAHKTAIIMPVGLYEYKMMPFGLRNSVNTYNVTSIKLLAVCPFVSLTWTMSLLLHTLLKSMSITYDYYLIALNKTV